MLLELQQPRNCDHFPSREGKCGGFFASVPLLEAGRDAPSPGKLWDQSVLVHSVSAASSSSFPPPGPGSSQPPLLRKEPQHLLSQLLPARASPDQSLGPGYKSIRHYRLAPADSQHTQTLPQDGKSPESRGTPTTSLLSGSRDCFCPSITCQETPPVSTEELPCVAEAPLCPELPGLVGLEREGETRDDETSHGSALLSPRIGECCHGDGSSRASAEPSWIHGHAGMPRDTSGCPGRIPGPALPLPAQCPRCWAASQEGPGCTQGHSCCSRARQEDFGSDFHTQLCRPDKMTPKQCSKL